MSAPEPTAGERCPECRHAPHDSLGLCPNMASDNDCGCKHGTRPATPDADDASTEASEGLTDAERAMGVYAYMCQASAFVYHHHDVEDMLAAREAKARAEAWDEGAQAATDWINGGAWFATMPENPHRAARIAGGDAT